MKSEDINKFLAEKFQKESARLKSWGTKTDDKAAISFAMSVSEYVRALMCYSRYRELKRFEKWLKKNETTCHKCSNVERFGGRLLERMEATKSMSEAIRKFAEDKESKRAWKPKEHKHHHEHHRSSRSRKHRS